jgi:hypothetical protein
MPAKKKSGLMNPKHEKLTPEKLREPSGQNLSDEQAEEVIWALIQYARIVYDFTVQQIQSVGSIIKSRGII